MYVSHRNYEAEILDALSKKRMTIQELSDELKVSRPTIDKYINRLEAQGLVDYEFLGIAKLYWRR